MEAKDGLVMVSRWSVKVKEGLGSFGNSGSNGQQRDFSSPEEFKGTGGASLVGDWLCQITVAPKRRRQSR